MNISILCLRNYRENKTTRENKMRIGIKVYPIHQKMALLGIFLAFFGSFWPFRPKNDPKPVNPPRPPAFLIALVKPDRLA